MSVFQPVVLGIAPPYSQQDGPVWVDTTPDPLSRLARSSTGVLRTEGPGLGAMLWRLVGRVRKRAHGGTLSQEQTVPG